METFLSIISLLYFLFYGSLVFIGGYIGYNSKIFKNKREEEEIIDIVAE